LLLAALTDSRLPLAVMDEYCRLASKFHALRHTYVSFCVVAGINSAKLSGHMGHASSA
jgi:hypothetical protein